MTNQDLVLNIAVNMGRLCRFGLEKREGRVKQFITDTEVYLDQINKETLNSKFTRTFEKFQIEFNELKNDANYNYIWAEKALTWANILTHRAKLA